MKNNRIPIRDGASIEWLNKIKKDFDIVCEDGKAYIELNLFKFQRGVIDGKNN